MDTAIMRVITTTELTNGSTDHPKQVVTSIEAPDSAFQPLNGSEIIAIFNIAVANALSVATQQCYQEAKSRRGHK